MGHANQVLVPTQIGTDTWSVISCGIYHSIGIKTDGTMWGWGADWNGQVGIGSVAGLEYYSPVQIGTDTDWVDVSCGDQTSIARKSNGTIWGWGWNQGDILGLGPPDLVPSPVQIGTDTDWISVTHNSYHSVGFKIPAF
jgi:alpha-tubulin suppressor-like RCC1 family protein